MEDGEWYIDYEAYDREAEVHSLFWAVAEAFGFDTASRMHPDDLLEAHAHLVRTRREEGG